MKKPSVIAIALMIILAVSGCGSVQQTAAEPGQGSLFFEVGEAIKEDHPMMKGLKAICKVADEN